MIETLFSNNKLEQAAVQFACRTATRKDLTSSEKNTLRGLLEEINPEQFQRFENPNQSTGSGVFEAFAEYPIGAATATVPSFVMNNTSVTILMPLKIGEKDFYGTSIRSFMERELPRLNTTMSDTFNKVQGVIRGLRYQRAGKIFEFTLSPTDPESKSRLLEKIFKYGLGDVSEVRLSLTKTLEDRGQVCNLLTQIAYNQLRPSDPIRLNVRVDINNRELLQSMEPAQIVQAWSKGDALIDSHLESFLNVE